MQSPPASISCVITSTDISRPLGLEVWVDDQLTLDVDHVRQTIDWYHELPEDSADHELRFVLKNKTQDHTTVDQSGNIINDACLTLSDIKFDGIELGHMFIELSEYTHDFNGAGPMTKETFYGTMGCNGTVSLKFTTPIYLWLLENL
jgi:hypothetical protein